MNFIIKKFASAHSIFVLLFLLVQSTVMVAQEHPNNMNQEGLYEVTSIGLNVRSKPQKSSVVLGALKEGERVWVYRFNGKWGETNAGWVSGKYLEFVSSAPGQDQGNSAPHEQQRQIINNHIETNRDAISVTTSASHNNDASYESIINDFGGRLPIALIVGISAIYIVMLLLGMAEKVVVYFDEADLVISLMPWFILFIAIVLALIYQPNEDTPDPQRLREIQEYIWAVALPMTAIFSLWSIWLSIKYNHSLLIGLPYGFFKLISVLIGVLVLTSQIATMKDDKTKRNQFFFAAMIFGVFIWLGKKLINGKKVYRNHGWTLPK